MMTLDKTVWLVVLVCDRQKWPTILSLFLSPSLKGAPLLHRCLGSEGCGVRLRSPWSWETAPPLLQASLLLHCSPFHHHLDFDTQYYYSSPWLVAREVANWTSCSSTLWLFELFLVTLLPGFSPQPDGSFLKYDCLSWSTICGHSLAFYLEQTLVCLTAQLMTALCLSPQSNSLVFLAVQSVAALSLCLIPLKLTLVSFTALLVTALCLIPLKVTLWS